MKEVGVGHSKTSGIQYSWYTLPLSLPNVRWGSFRTLLHIVETSWLLILICKYISNRYFSLIWDQLHNIYHTFPFEVLNYQVFKRKLRRRWAGREYSLIILKQSVGSSIQICYYIILRIFYMNSNYTFILSKF